MGLFLFFVSVILVIGIHELGHLVIAHFFNIKAQSFNIGAGPKLFSYNAKNGTVWAFRLLPIGGNVSFDAGQFESSHPIKKIIVYFAGPGANILSFLLIIFGYVMIFNGDILVALITCWKLLEILVQAYVGMFSVIGEIFFPHPVNHIESILGMAIASSSPTTHTTLIMRFFDTFLALSAGVALLNLMPFPVLDGGGIVMGIIELFVGQKIARKIKGILWPIGMVCLFSLTIFIIAKDITRLFI